MKRSYTPLSLRSALLLASAGVGSLSLPGHAEPVPTLADIVEARTIDSLSVSPDGLRIAYRVLSPSLARDVTAATWSSVEISGSSAAAMLGSETRPIWMPLYEIPDDGVSQWNRDSRSLFVLQQEDAAIQVHEIGPDHRDVPLTHDGADVLSFAVSADGMRLSYQVRDSRSAIASAQAAEIGQGIHFDRTVFGEGMRLTSNFFVGSKPTTIRSSGRSGVGIEAFAGDISTREIDVAGAMRSPAPNGGANMVATRRDYLNAFVEYRDLPDRRGVAIEDGGRTLRFAKTGMMVQLKQIGPPDRKLLLKTHRVEATLADGSTRPCMAEICTGLSSALREIAINDDTGEVVILHEKDFSARSALFGWNPVTNAIRTIYTAEGSLDGGSTYSNSICPKAGRYLICVQAGPTRPQRLIRIDLTSGAVLTLADPNAVLAAKSYPKAEYRSWTDRKGRAWNGVLLLPNGKPSALPLVITTYRCRGFLRGGTSDLVPEHMLTQMGFAALCVNNNNMTINERGEDGGEIPVPAHKASLDGYQAIIDILVGQGIVDRAKVGIAGHSFSSIGTAYALSHSNMFNAAVMGGGITIDPGVYFLTAPSADSWRRGAFPEMGLPAPTLKGSGAVWNAVSPALNADKIDAPLLMLLPENEWQMNLQLYTYIQDAGGTVDMYLFPYAGHMVSRLPTQQYWRKQRALDWFGFWLQGKQRRTAETMSQFEHWTALRDARSHGHGD